MPIFLSLIKKETLHLLRDARTLTVVLVMPVVLLLLFGFAISTEVNDVRVVAVVEQHTPETREALARLNAGSYFTLTGILPADEADRRLRRGEADAIVVLRTEAGRPVRQIITDASNPGTAETVTAYLESALGEADGTPATVRTLYNPQLRSAYHFVPGIMGMIFILICAMMTSVSIVSEKESGTMDLLVVSPARPGVIILGKIVPYFLLSCLILALMLGLSYTVLGLPFSAGVLHVVWLSLLYIVLSLALGLLVSTLAGSQVTALLVSGVLFMLPVILLSGMIFPIENMPAPLRWLAALIPARWYIPAMRTLMIQRLGAAHVAAETAVLAAMTLAVLALALRNLNRKN